MRILRAASLVLFLASAHAADFPAPVNTQPGEPMPAADALATIKAPPGFTVSLFASEPEVQQPIGMATDARGRLWVAENYTYGEARVGFDLRQRDRIVILEDTDRDGRADKRTVFADDLQRLSSVEVGFGGVWVLCAPQLLFFPDKNGDDIPDGKPVVLLDGFDFGPVRHNIVNGLRWGPDGWLYGRHGIQATSHVGAPGTPSEKRIAMNCAIWRFHPTRKIFEVVATGTTNPWGMDWDQHGEAFFTNTVIGHLWHVIPGAHYQRMYGEELAPHTYGLIEQHADHYHWDASGKWNKAGRLNEAANTLGGGHAHEGCLIYQGGTWPEEYRNRLFTINFYGRRINMEKLERDGSGYVAKHGADFLNVGDPWFRGVDLVAAPDGGVFLSDWSDTGECHENEGVHRTSGRIYKISAGEPSTVPADLAKLTNVELVQLQNAPNDWLARQSRRLLQERGAAGGKLQDAKRELLALWEKEMSILTAEALVSVDKKTSQLERESREMAVVHQLRALWALRAIGAASDAFLRKALAHPDEHLRIWAIRFLTEDTRALKTVPAEFLRLAEKDTSPAVRLALASALQRFPVEARAALARPLLQHAEDAADHNLPLMLWYGLIPLGDSDPAQLATLGGRAKIPLTARCIARRLAERMAEEPLAVDLLLGGALAGTPAHQTAILLGLADGLKKATSVPMPVAWEQFAAKLNDIPDPALDAPRAALDKLFLAGQRLTDARRTVLDPKMLPEERRDALQQLMEAKSPALRDVCAQLATDLVMRFPAALVLTSLDDPRDTPVLFAQAKVFVEPERGLLYSALASRPQHAVALLNAIVTKKLPRTLLTPAVIEKLHSHGNETLDKTLDQQPPASADSPAKPPRRR
ncbi:MAG: hypothetical protein K8R23_09705 [Chthoniobacter sp.]|nr:hypothetical protein [Chthoniobacter sp.]